MMTMRRLTASAAPRLSRTRTGAATDTSPTVNRVADLAEKILPILVLGGTGLVLGGTLWGLKGLLAGAVIGSAAGYGVQTVAAASKGSGQAAKGPDFSVPVPGTYVPPAHATGEGPELTPFPTAPTFLPTPSLWAPISTVNSRARVDEHRHLEAGNTIQFIAQYTPFTRTGDDTSDEIKLAAKVMVARPSLVDADPAYGVEVIDLVQENDVTDGLERPKVGSRMVVAIDQVLTVAT